MTKKLTILYNPIHYVLDAQNSGSEFSWAYQIFQHITRENAISSLYITGGTRGISDKRVDSINIFDPKKLNLSFVNILKFYLFIFLEGIKILQKEKVDVIHHVLPFYVGRTFNILALFSRNPFVIGPIQSNLSILDMDLNTRDARGFSKKKESLIHIIENGFISLILPLISLLSNWTLKKASRIIVINNKTKELLVEKGIQKNKIFIIPPGINSERIQYKSQNVKKSIINIITVGYLLKRKGIDLIIKALSEVVKKNDRICLHIIGDGPEKRSLQELVQQLNLTKNVVFHGFIPQSQIASYYQNASIFVSMSKAEGFATVCLEAMASGLAIISSKVGGFSDAVKEGKTGYLVEQGDYMTLASRIIYLLENKTKIREMGEKARRDVEKYYDWKNVIIPKYISLYKNLF